MLEDRIQRQAPPLSVIPDEHRPLIAKLAHESDKTLAALSKHIRQELLPAADDDEDRQGGTSSTMAALPLSSVEAAIKTVMQRNNYGLDGPSGGKAPAAVCVWRWEVMEQHRDWLPKNAREKAESRLAERLQAKQDLWGMFELLPQDERDAILDPKGTGKLPQKELNVADISKTPALNEKGSPQSAKKKQMKKAEEENDATTPKPSGSKAPRAPKSVDPAKEQEKLEKKAAKADKEKKAKDAQDKSRSLMASFFAKPKKSPTKPSPKNVESSTAGPSNVQSEFNKIFKPFVLKKDTELAPTNWFLAKGRRKRTQPAKIDDGVIVIDDDEETEDGDVEMINFGSQSPHLDVEAMSITDHLRSVVSSLPPPPTYPSWRRLPYKQDPRSKLKTHHYICVKDIVTKLSEAEVAGDISIVRSLLSQLNDRSVLPAKVFIFTEDARPGYYGTWTRSSKIIGPRTPFAQDVLVFDYGYDSGEEWEEEPVGDADDVVDDGEDEEDGDDADSDADSWLVDDDDEPDFSSLDDLENMSSGIPDLPVVPKPTKRKAQEAEKKIEKKRKLVIPLVPFAKGPCWESSIGRCEHNIFDPYRIQMFNDTPFPIDPFTFVSTCVEDSKREREHIKSNKPVLMNDGVFVVPSLPERLQPNATASPNTAASSSSTTSPTPKKAPAVPKAPFPDAHLPFLLEKIASLKTGSISFLVEAVHRELREHKVKKNAVEAKVREVGEKCKEKKFWVVKPGIRVGSLPGTVDPL
ncbi:hypothetical protein DXG03_001098 [Asterophora parasitica]|uniref:Chromatin assembly factor 1 subunit A dimerization domain-containing protein n=1 Tax=Asterophora parasitica TaxID=117018 RepID=A0A9P7KE25_9AGAR|nr:hypothetical protein DXG03_001098 [Asterophora parasitica]